MKNIKSLIDRQVIRAWTWAQILKNEKGQGLVEYAILITLILLAAIVTIRAIGPKVDTAFNKINANLP